PAPPPAAGAAPRAGEPRAPGGPGTAASGPRAAAVPGGRPMPPAGEAPAAAAPDAAGAGRAARTPAAGRPVRTARGPGSAEGTRILLVLGRSPGMLPPARRIREEGAGHARGTLPGGRPAPPARQGRRPEAAAEERRRSGPSGGSAQEPVAPRSPKPWQRSGRAACSALRDRAPGRRTGP